MSEPKKDVSDREHFLSVLTNITFTALQTENLDDLTQLLADRLGEIIDADGCYLTLWDEQQKVAIPAAATGALREKYRSLTVTSDEPTITEHVLNKAKPLVIEDAWNSKYAVTRISRQLPSKSMLAVPLMQGQKKIGAALISYSEHHDFTPVEIERCEQAAQQISLAIANRLSLDALTESQKALESSEAHLDEAQARAQLGSWEYNPKTEKLVWSRGFYRLFDIPYGMPPSIKAILEQVSPEHQQQLKETLLRVVSGDHDSFHEITTKSGRRLTGKIFRRPYSEVVTGTVHDVTEQQKLEADLSQARKMEAVGTLAGGIAHNFNNILTVIIGNYEIIKTGLTPDSTEEKVLDQCLEAAERAALLTRQLLVVSRKQELKPTGVNLNDLISDLAGLLKPLIGEHIALTTTLSPSLRIVHADKGQIEQVIMNLVLNARDALSNGGKLNIDTKNTDMEGMRWVSMTVTDNGSGIDERTLPHIFDPFYTTKDEGKGTGLGLATVASIVQQSHGEVSAKSSAEFGTSFTVLLPEHSSGHVAGDSELSKTESTQQAQKHQHILIVEDHESLRNVAKFTLEKAGYSVSIANDAHAAMNVLAGQTVDVLLTDVQLPEGVSGPELAQRMNCQIPTIFMSGLRDQLPSEVSQYFLPKPFRPHELIGIVESALENAS